MKIVAIVLSLAGAGLLAFALALGIWAGMPANPLATLGILLAEAGSITKVVLILLAMQVIVVFILGVVPGGREQEPSRGSRLALLILVPPGLGLAATLWACLSIQRAMAGIYFPDLRVIAPSVAEALMPFAFGLIVGALAAGLRALRANR